MEGWWKNNARAVGDGGRVGESDSKTDVHASFVEVRWVHLGVWKQERQHYDVCNDQRFNSTE